MKIENMTDFVKESIHALNELHGLQEYYENIPFEQQKMEVYLFSVLLLSGTDAVRQNGEIVLITKTGRMSMEETKLKNIPFLKDILKSLRTENGESGKTVPDAGRKASSADIIRKQPAPEPIPPEQAALETTVQKSGTFGSVKEDIPESVKEDIPEKEKIQMPEDGFRRQDTENTASAVLKDKPEPSSVSGQDGGILRLKDIPQKSTDGERTRSVSSMWMLQKEIIYGREDSYCEETFIITVYPLAMNIERMALPMLCIIQHENAVRYVFTDAVRSSAEIETDDFGFGVSLCYQKGKLKVIITQKNNAYKKISERTVADIQGKFIPSCFGIKVNHGNEWAEFYPVCMENDRQTGLVPCVYRAKMNGQQETGMTDYRHEILLAYQGGAHGYGVYWTDDDNGERQLTVEEQ